MLAKTVLIRQSFVHEVFRLLQRFHRCSSQEQIGVEVNLITGILAPETVSVCIPVPIERSVILIADGGLPRLQPYVPDRNYAHIASQKYPHHAPLLIRFREEVAKCLSIIGSMGSDGFDLAHCLDHSRYTFSGLPVAQQFERWLHLIIGDNQIIDRASFKGGKRFRLETADSFFRNGEIHLYGTGGSVDQVIVTVLDCASHDVFKT